MKLDRCVLMALAGLSGGLVLSGAMGQDELVVGDAGGGGEELELVVVTGTGTARKLKETAVRTQVFGGAELEQVQVSRLSDALDYAPGLRVETTCQNCGVFEI